MAISERFDAEDNFVPLVPLIPSLSLQSALRNAGTLGTTRIDGYQNTVQSLADFTCDDIQLLDARIEHLTRQRSALDQQLSRLRSLNGPVRLIPHDVLIRVFEYLPVTFIRPEQTKSRVFPTLSPLVAAASVCHHWRRTISSTPSLWSTFRVPSETITAKRTDNLDRQRHLLELHLRNSSGSPLYFTLFANYAGPDAMWDMLVLNIDRWCTAQLENITMDAILRSLGNGSDSGSTLVREFPCLEHLLLPFQPLHFSSENPLKTFKNAPKLRSLTLRGLVHGGLDLPWSQLEVLALEGASPKHSFYNASDVLGIVTHTPRLRKLSVRLLEKQGPAQNLPAASIFLSHLETLHLQGGTFPSLITQLSCPKLTSLSIQGECSSLIAQDALNSFLSTLVELSSVHFILGVTDEKHIVKILQNIPTVTSLSLGALRHMKDTFLQALFFPDSEQEGQITLLPRLGYLRLIQMPGADVRNSTIQETLVRLCENRLERSQGFANRSRLQRLVARAGWYHESFWSGELQPRIQRLHSMGCRCS